MLNNGMSYCTKLKYEFGTSLSSLHLPPFRINHIYDFVGVKCQQEIGVGTVPFNGMIYDKVDYGLVVTTECLEGYFVFTGDKERTCLQDGSLSGNPLTCFETSKPHTAI